MKTFGKTLKELRLENNLTQKQLAEELNITVPTLSHWECDYQEPSFGDLIQLAKYFEVSTDYLLSCYDRELVNADSFPKLSAYTKEEKKLIEDYRSLPPQLQNMIKDTIQTFTTSEGNKKNKRKI